MFQRVFIGEKNYSLVIINFLHFRHGCCTVFILYLVPLVLIFLVKFVLRLRHFLYFLIGKNIVSEEKAFYLGIFIFAIFYYTWSSLEFNHNIAQMPIWAGLIYLFYLALNKNTWTTWLLFGLVTGISMLTKYSVAILVFSIVLFAFLIAFAFGFTGHFNFTFNSNGQKSE